MELDFKPVGASPRCPRAAPKPGVATSSRPSRPSLGAAHLHAIASTLAAEGANIEKIWPPLRRDAGLGRDPRAPAAGARRGRPQEDAARRRDERGLRRLAPAREPLPPLEAARRHGHGLDAHPHRGHRRARARRRRGPRGLEDHRARHAGRDGLRRVAAPARRAAQGPGRRGARHASPPTCRSPTAPRRWSACSSGSATASPIISGGFSRAAEALKRRLDLDYAYSNNLEVVGRQAHRPRRRPHRQRPAQGRAARDHRPGRGRAARPGHRRRRRRERRADARARRPGHRLPRQAQAARGRRHESPSSGLDAILYLLGISGRELHRSTTGSRRPTGRG